MFGFIFYLKKPKSSPKIYNLLGFILTSIQKYHKNSKTNENKGMKWILVHKPQNPENIFFYIFILTLMNKLF